MDHIGIDVHKRESQILHPRRGGRGDRAAHPHRARALRRRAGGPAPRPDCDRGLDRQRMGGPLPRGARPRGHRRGPELRAHVCDPVAQGQDRPAGCPRPGRGVPARGLPPRPSALRSPAACGVAAWWSATPSSRRARATSRSSEPCSASTATACPSGSAEHFVHRVQGLPLPGRLRSVVAPLLALMRPLNGQLTYSDATIEHLAVQDPRVLRCAPSPASAPSPPPPSSPPSTTSALPPRASARSLPRPRARRAQLGRDAAPRRDHQGRPLAHPLAPDSGRRLDPPPPPAAGGGAADLGPAHRRAPRETGGRGRPRPSPRRHPLCAAARWQRVRAPARSVSASSRG